MKGKNERTLAYKKTGKLNKKEYKKRDRKSEKFTVGCFFS